MSCKAPVGFLRLNCSKGPPKPETGKVVDSQDNCWSQLVVEMWRGSSLTIDHREVVEEEIPPFNHRIQLREPVQETKASRLRPDSPLILNTQA